MYIPVFFPPVLRIAVASAVAVALASTAQAQAEEEADWQEELEALEREWEEMEREWEEFIRAAPPTWMHLFSLQGGIGYNDNVLRSSVSRESSVFLQTGFDTTLWKNPRAEGPRYHMFLFGEGRHYIGNRDLDDDYILSLRGEGIYELPSEWSAVLPVNLDYNDEYVDVSTREAELDTIRFRGVGIGFSPALRYDLSDSDRVEGKAIVRRQQFSDPLDPYWETGGGLSWRHAADSATTFNFGSRVLFRRYDNREARDADGAILPGTRREFGIYHFDASVNHYWDEARRWRSRATAGAEINRDNAEGYFDFLRTHLSHRLIYQSRPWRIDTGLRYSHYQYDVRRTADGESNLNRRIVTADLRAELAVTHNLNLYSEYRHENVHSNETDSGYRVNTVLTGVEWLF